jgi:SET and MYND domain-containing protein 4
MDVSDQLLEVLSRKQLSTFATLPSHAGRVRYALQLLRENKLVPKLGVRQSKSNAVANTLRQHGNKFFAAKMYFQALEFYNKSICFAYERTEELGLGFSNRSAVYFEWELYGKCLENIRLARENHCPSRLLEKLAEREKKCKSAEEFTRMHPSLTYPTNCFQISENEKYGRHIVANRDLKVGDIVVVEPTFQSQLQKKYNYQRCANCLAENDLSLIPCPGCTSTMFCSPACLTVANVKFHKIECPIVEAISELEDDNLLMALRIVLKFVHDFETVETLGVLARICDENKKTMRMPDEGASMLDRFQFFHQLQHNIYRLEEEQMLRAAVPVALLVKLLTEKTNMKELSDTFLGLLFQYYRACCTNSHDIEVLERDKTNEIQVKSVGKGISLAFSMFNHSCAPNVRRISLSEGKTAVVVERPIKNGGQLLVSYGMDHLEWSKQNRQTTL